MITVATRDWLNKLTPTQQEYLKEELTFKHLVLSAYSEIVEGGYRRTPEHNRLFTLYGGIDEVAKLWNKENE